MDKHFIAGTLIGFCFFMYRTPQPPRDSADFTAMGITMLMFGTIVWGLYP